MSAVKEQETVTIIEPVSGLRIDDFKELREYRDLFFFLVWRDIKVLYAQTVLGFAWAIMNPLIQIVVFGIVFGSVAKIPSDGISYVLFSSVGIIPWTYMAEAMTNSSLSLVTGQSVLGKIYFPRLIFPLTSVFSKLVDFGISLVIILCMMIYYGVLPTWNLLLLPCFFLLMIVVPAGIGMWLSALAIRFRDVKFAMQFGIRMLMYSAPVVYSASSIPEKYRLLYSLNPLVAVIEGYRVCLLGDPVPWLYIVPGIVTGLAILLTGAIYFKKMERFFVDVI